MKQELTPAAIAVLLRVEPVRRANEFVSDGRTFTEDAKNAKGPTVLLVQNGSRFAGEQPADLNQLLDLLAETPLDPTFEDYGNFIDPCSISATDDKPLLPAGWTTFHGNFYLLSHGFQIETNDLEVIEQLTRAIRANQRSADYAEAKADIEQIKANRRASDERARKRDARR